MYPFPHEFNIMAQMPISFFLFASKFLTHHKDLKFYKATDSHISYISNHEIYITGIKFSKFYTHSIFKGNKSSPDGLDLLAGRMDE